MRITKLLILCAIFFANQALAKQESEQIVVKLKGVYASINAKQKDLPAATPAAGTTAKDAGKLFSTAYGVEASVGVFFTDHIAAEFSTGLTLYKEKAVTIQNMINNYPVANSSYSKSKSIKAIPSALLVQYHIAPYGALRPYVGVGYHYTYMLPGKAYKLDNASGLVLQAGVDFVLMDDTYITFDIKRYSLETKAKYSTSVLRAGGKSVTSKLKLNPIVAALGIGFRL